MQFVYILLFVTMFVAIYFLITFYSNLGKLSSPETKREPKVSIILPVYNEEKNLPDTLEYIKRLDYPKDKLEVIFVNDGSTDNSVEVIKQYAEKNWKIFTKENQGCKSYAVNYGLERAKGEFLFTLDSDCRPSRDLIRKMLGHFEDPKVMVVVPAVKIWKPRGFWQRVQVIEYAIAVYMRKTLQFMQAEMYANAAPMIRREFYDKYGGYAHTISEDLEIGLRALYRGYKVAYTMDSCVYTVVPDKFKGIANQRIRWVYGLLENVKKYYKIISWKYGEAGMFYIPVALGYALLPIYFVARSINYFFGGASSTSTMIAGTNFDVSYAILDIQNFMISYKLIYFVALMLIVLGVITYFTAKKYGRIQNSYPLEYIFYAFIYLWIIGAFNLIALVRYLLKREPVWRAGMKKMSELNKVTV